MTFREEVRRRNYGLIVPQISLLRGRNFGASSYRCLSFAGGKVPAKTQFFYDGQFVDSKTDKWIDVHNPATNEVVTKVPECTPQEMEKATEAAARAFPEWSRTSPLKRQEIMFKYQGIIKANLVSILFCHVVYAIAREAFLTILTDRDCQAHHARARENIGRRRG